MESVAHQDHLGHLGILVRLEPLGSRAPWVSQEDQESRVREEDQDPQGKPDHQENQDFLDQRVSEVDLGRWDLMALLDHEDPEVPEDRPGSQDLQEVRVDPDSLDLQEREEREGPRDQQELPDHLGQEDQGEAWGRLVSLATQVPLDLLDPLARQESGDQEASVDLQVLQAELVQQDAMVCQDPQVNLEVPGSWADLVNQDLQDSPEHKVNVEMADQRAQQVLQGVQDLLGQEADLVHAASKAHQDLLAARDPEAPQDSQELPENRENLAQKGAMDHLDQGDPLAHVEVWDPLALLEPQEALDVPVVTAYPEKGELPVLPVALEPLACLVLQGLEGREVRLVRWEVLVMRAGLDLLGPGVAQVPLGLQVPLDRLEPLVGPDLPETVATEVQ